MHSLSSHTSQQTHESHVSYNRSVLFALLLLIQDMSAAEWNAANQCTISKSNQVIEATEARTAAPSVYVVTAAKTTDPDTFTSSADRSPATDY
eukprot:scaffold2450_cov311-Chaetoceros_neogracile.AAC.5